MKTNLLASLAGAALLTIATMNGQAQTLRVPAPSPSQTVKQAFGLGEVTIDYSRPGVKGRVIFGDVVPYGKIWRTGANGTTKITFSEDVKLQGNAVKAGTYGLYTIPGKDTWDILLTKDLTLAGNTANYNTADEVVRFSVKAMTNAMMVENFTINIDAIKPEKAKLLLMWDHTAVAINMTTDIDEKIMKSIDVALKNDTRPYFQAASYYYDNNRDLNQALTWVNKAIESNPAFYVVHLKAKIQLKMKDNKAAIATARESMALAREAKNDDYVKLNEKLIEKAKKG